jgi:hypothetical protein
MDHGQPHPVENAMIASLLLVAACQLAPVPDPYIPHTDHVDSRKFVIIYDKNKESRVLASELTRDWTTSGKKSPPKLQAWAALQSRVKSHVVLKTREECGREFWHVNDGYPFYRYGDNGEVRGLPREMFAGSGTALLSMEAIIANETMDLSSWRNECYSIVLQSELMHVGAAIRWLNVSSPEAVESLSSFYPQWGETENIGFLRIQERFSAYDGYPAYDPPALPESPLRKMPWERGYVFPPEIVPVLIAPPPPEESPL